ncbi:hypothetical protein [Actinomadura rudentiformis]|uniref:Large adhesin n=1 Tax=Actinomadura rudentiformis TaxID=359158 RepID=A0A6H9YIR9_9ACTN|nr:hypothetical protein [Actinomadura rudentiformis]KAB2346574.1 hypothetical protein F8566_24330 [Actinomadura rudentiformis]
MTSYIVVFGLIVVVVLVVVLVALGMRASRAAREDGDDWMADEQQPSRGYRSAPADEPAEDGYGTGYDGASYGPGQAEPGFDRRVAGGQAGGGQPGGAPLAAGPLAAPTPAPAQAAPAPPPPSGQASDEMADDDYWATITFDKPKFPWQHDAAPEKTEAELAADPLNAQGGPQGPEPQSPTERPAAGLTQPVSMNDLGHGPGGQGPGAPATGAVGGLLGSRNGADAQAVPTPPASFTPAAAHYAGDPSETAADLQAFGSGTGPQPAFGGAGDQSFGGGGSDQQPYGSPDQSPYGSPEQPAYGSPDQSPYGTPDQQQPFGAPEQQPYGSGPEQSPYGVGDPSPYGAPDQQPAYGNGSQGAYGAGDPLGTSLPAPSAGPARQESYDLPMSSGPLSSDPRVSDPLGLPLGRTDEQPARGYEPPAAPPAPPAPPAPSHAEPVSHGGWDGGGSSGGDTDSNKLPTVDELLQRIQTDRARSAGGGGAGALGGAGSQPETPSFGSGLSDPLNDPLNTSSGSSSSYGSTGPWSTPASASAGYDNDQSGPSGTFSGTPGSGTGGGGYGQNDGYPSAPAYGDSPRYDDPLGGGRESYGSYGTGSGSGPGSAGNGAGDSGEPGRYTDFSGSSYNGASDPLSAPTPQDTGSQGGGYGDSGSTQQFGNGYFGSQQGYGNSGQAGGSGGDTGGQYGSSYGSGNSRPQQQQPDDWESHRDYRR